MDNVQIFESEKFGSVRTINREDGPWFVAADVCRALEIGNPSDALSRLDDDEKALVSIEGLSRGNDKANIINEPGLYALVLGSRKPEAKAFKRWITHEVVPAIRKKGFYNTHDCGESVEEFQRCLIEQAEALELAAKRSNTFGFGPFDFSSPPALRPCTPEGAARILAGVRLAEALPLVRAALVEAGINLPEVELVPNQASRSKYTVRIKEPHLDREALVNAIAKALAHQMLSTSDLAEMAGLPTSSIDKWVRGQYVPTNDALARLDAELRSRCPTAFTV